MLIECHFCGHAMLHTEYEELLLNDEGCPECGQMFGAY